MADPLNGSISEQIKNLLKRPKGDATSEQIKSYDALVKIFLEKFKEKITCPVTHLYFLYPVSLTVQDMDKIITLERDVVIQKLKSGEGYPSSENKIINYYSNDIITDIVDLYLRLDPDAINHQYKSPEVEPKKVVVEEKKEEKKIDVVKVEEKKITPEEQKKINDEKIISEKRAAEIKRMLEKKRGPSGGGIENKPTAEENRIAAEKRVAETNRIAEEKRVAEENRIAEEKRLAEENRVAEENRIAEEKRLTEENRIAEEERLAEENRIAEEERLAEENRLAEEERLAEENRLAEEKRLAEELRIAEETRIAEEKIIEEYNQIIEKKRLKEEKANPSVKPTVAVKESVPVKPAVTSSESVDDNINMPNIVGVLFKSITDNHNVNYRRVLLIDDNGNEQNKFLSAMANVKLSDDFFVKKTDIKFVKSENFKYGVFCSLEQNIFNLLTVKYIENSHYFLIFAYDDNSWQKLLELKEQIKDLKLYALSYDSASNTASVKDLDKKTITEIKSRSSPVKINNAKVAEMTLHLLALINNMRQEGMEKFKEKVKVEEEEVKKPAPKKGWFSRRKKS